MSYSAPPGLKSSTPQPPANLPPRPPLSAVPPTFSKANHGASTANSGYNAFTAFAPRTVNNASYRTNNTAAQYSAPPTISYSSQPQHSTPATITYGAGLQHPPQPEQVSYSSSADYSAPQIRNPFLPPSTPTPASSAFSPYGAPVDPEMAAQIEQWQSAYVSKDSDRIRGNANQTPLGGVARTDSPSIGTGSGKENTKEKTVYRSGGGTTWADSSLLEWDPAHFRLFVGNLAGEVTDDSLLKAFSKYTSVSKARVVRDKRTTKSKGFGFVAFANGDDYFLAAREMQGKYIGSHPVLLKKAESEIKAANVKDDRRGKGKHGKGGSHSKTQNDGVQKKVPKTKGGLKVLG